MTRSTQKSKKLSRGTQLTAQQAFGKRVRAIRERMEMGQDTFAVRLGVSSNHIISAIERGDRDKATLIMISALANLAISQRVSLAWLFAGTGEMDRTSAADEDWSWSEHADRGAIYSRMAEHVLAGQICKELLAAEPGESRLAVLERFSLKLPGGMEVTPSGVRSPGGYRTVPPEDVKGENWPHHYVPVLGRVAAGVGIDKTEPGEYPPEWASEYVIYDNELDSPVAVRVSGDSMNPDYQDRDMVIVDTARQAQAGEICVVLIDIDGQREARLKRLRLTGGKAVLESLNRNHPAEHIERRRIIAAYRIADHLPR